MKELFLLSQDDWLRGAAIQSEAQSHPEDALVGSPTGSQPLLRTPFSADVNPSPGFPVAGLIVCEVYTKIPAFAYFGVWGKKRKAEGVSCIIDPLRVALCRRTQPFVVM